MKRIHLVLLAWCVTLLSAGCRSQPGAGLEPAPVTTPPSEGIVYYSDGAGGGGPITNWGRHVRLGFAEAHYPGTFVEYDWETGFGIVADQMSSDAYKRMKAAHLAELIQQYAAQHPAAPISLMGLSAGTAVDVFALEQLPPGRQVDNVVLLSSSIASDYDMTRALCHVKGLLYVTTSRHDDILSIAVPMFGTADRQPGTIGVAGIDGFALPPDASAETIRLYTKIRYLPWKPQYEADGDFGSHTGTTIPPFIRDQIAPLIMIRLSSP